MPKPCQTNLVWVQIFPECVQGNLAQLWYLDFLALSFEKQRMHLEKGSEIQNSEFWISPWGHGSRADLEILENQMAKLSYYDLLVIWWTKTLKFGLYQNLYFSPQAFSQLPFRLNCFT
jgi:hypothetical protein